MASAIKHISEKALLARISRGVTAASALIRARQQKEVRKPPLERVLDLVKNSEKQVFIGDRKLARGLQERALKLLKSNCTSAEWIELKGTLDSIR